MSCCNEFNRSALLRQAIATPGAGLPSIEGGMPLPAGTGLSRRSFLARTSGLAMAVFGANMLSPRAFEDGIAHAQAGGPQPVLVSIFLAGGIDSLSLLAPVGHSQYTDLRPGLAIPVNPALTFADDPSLQWHPSAAPLRDLHAAGRLTAIPAIGYDDPNQSHFTSRHFWETGGLDPHARLGWLGRFLDRHGVADNPLQGLSLGYNLAPSLAPDGVPVAAVGEPESYSFWTRDVWSINNELMDGYGALGALATGDPALRQARGAASMAMTLRNQLGPLAGLDPYDAASVSYPDGNNPFPRRLAVLAEMLERQMPVRCVAIEANGGYDTHDNQEGTFGDDLSLFSRSIKAFQDDLEARGLANRVLIHVWSEFGRRAEENGSGTDHGAAGTSFLIGTRVRGDMIGEFRGLAPSDLDHHGNLKHSVDYRAIYRGIVEQWFGVEADGIIPGAGSFTPPPLIA